MTGDTFEERRLAEAYAWVARGARVLALHSGQKRPIGDAWQKRGARTPDEVDRLFAQHPDANLGMITGSESGVLVLDVDVKNGALGLETWNAIVDEFGINPDAIPHSCTPSGGMHFFFRMPKNAGHISTGSAGRGIDVLGDGGHQVVLPPSRLSDGGEYTVGVAIDGKLPKLPKGLLELLLAGSSKPAPATAAPVAPTELTAAERDRHRAYASSAIDREIATLRSLHDLKPGEGAGWDDTTFQVSCNLVEFANSPYYPLTLDEARALVMEHAPRDDGFPDSRVAAKFDSAVKKIDGGMRDALEDPRAGIRFDAAPWPADAPAAAEPVDAFAHLPEGVAAEARRITERKAALAAVEAVEYAARPRLADLLLTRSQLASLPTPAPLIEGILNAGSLVMLYGPPATGKSAVAQTMGLSIASGAPWLGHEVPNPGPVLYIAAEGQSGIPKRVDAWEDAWKVSAPDTFAVLPTAVNLSSDAAVADVAQLVGELKPTLIVFDTLNGLAYGLEENSASAMGLLVASIRRIKDASPGATALILHHSGKDKSLRGSTALPGAMDTIITLNEIGKGFTLDVTKEKDGENRRLGEFFLKKSGDSIIVNGNMPGAAALEEGLDRTSDERALAHLVSQHGSLGATRLQWVKGLVGEGMHERTAQRATKRLVESIPARVLVDGTRCTPAPKSPEGQFARPVNPNKKGK